MGNPSTSNVVVGKPLAAGGAWVAPTGSTLPTTVSSTLNTSFIGVGYISDDGLTKGEDRDTDRKFAWGGDTIAALQKSITITFKFTISEFLNSLAHTIVYGDSSVTTTAATSSAGNQMTIAASSAVSPYKSWVFQIVSGPSSIRIVVPKAQVTDLEDVEFKDDDTAGVGITLTAFPDSSGKYFYQYSDDGQKTS